MDEKRKRMITRGISQFRLRMSVLYYCAATMDRLVLGTANKSELRLGYFTKHGDAAVDLMPIGDVYKSDVREIAEFLLIPSNITTKKSSARLWKGQTTECEIGLTYEKIDAILKQITSDNRKRDTYLGIP
jgi:NAD+ synthase